MFLCEVKKHTETANSQQSSSASGRADRACSYMASLQSRWCNTWKMEKRLMASRLCSTSAWLRFKRPPSRSHDTMGTRMSSAPIACQICSVSVNIQAYVRLAFLRWSSCQASEAPALNTEMCMNTDRCRPEPSSVSHAEAWSSCKL